MTIPRSLVLDLLPLYVAGDVSPDTRAFVEDYIQHDPELALEIARLRSEDAFDTARLPAPPAELALRSFRRTRARLDWQRWVFSGAMFFTLIGCSFEISTEGAHVTEWHLLMTQSPLIFGTSFVLGLVCWAIYFVLRRR